MTLLAMFGCAPASRDTASSSVEGMIVEATIEQVTETRGARGEGYSADHVRVGLLDRDGHTLEPADLRVEMNDVPLGARNAHGNFYDRHPFYRLDDAASHLAPDRECRFSLVRTDGTHHAAGLVRTPLPLAPNQFEFPESVSRDEPLVLTWRDLEEPVEMVIFRSHAYADMAGNVVLEDGGPANVDALRRTIGPSLLRRPSGSLEIPRMFLADHGGRRVRGIAVELTVAHSGTVPVRFSRRSTIRATRRLVFHADLTD